MTRYTFDSFAWVEYLNGTPLGGRVRDLVVDEKNEVFTPASVVMEVVSLAERRGAPGRTAAERIEAGSVVVPLDFSLAVTAGRIHAEKRRTIPDFPYGDAAVLGVARTLRARTVSGDSHFRGEPDVLFLR